jgi:hypothetical protein
MPAVFLKAKSFELIEQPSQAHRLGCIFEAQTRAGGFFGNLLPR